MSIVETRVYSSELNVIKDDIFNIFQKSTTAAEVSQKIMPIFTKFKEIASKHPLSVPAMTAHNELKKQIESVPAMYSIAYNEFRNNFSKKYLLLNIGSLEDKSSLSRLPKEIIVNIAQLAIYHIPHPSNYNLDEIGIYFAHNCHFPLELV